MRLRLAGVLLVVGAIVAHFVILRPLHRDVAGIQAAFASTRVSRQAKRAELVRLESARRDFSGLGTDAVALALDLRPGLVACLERVGLYSVEFGFEGDAPAKLRFRMAARGGFPSALEALDCVTSPKSGVTPNLVTITQGSPDLRLALSAVLGRVPLSSPGRVLLPRDPFVDAAPVSPRSPVGRATDALPAAVVAALPTPAPVEPEVRLVGLVERRGQYRAALSVRGEVVVVSIGDVVAGYTVWSLDPSSGAVVTDPAGQKIHLPLPDAQ